MDSKQLEEIVGWSSGALTSMFFLSSFLTSYAWGRLSDRIGRRPVLLLGTALSGIATIFFAISYTFQRAMVFRFVVGLFSGNLGVLKTYLGEVTSCHNQARAFSGLSIVYAATSVMAPPVGGFLGPWSSRMRMPYAFWPGVACAFVAGFVVILGFFYLPETTAFLIQRRRRVAELEMTTLEVERMTAADLKSPIVLDLKTVVDSNASREIALEDHSFLPSPSIHGSKNTKKLGDQKSQVVMVDDDDDSSKSVFQKRSLLLPISLYGMICITQISMLNLMPMAFRADPGVGGLGLPSQEIGLLLSIQGISITVFQILFYPRLVKRFGIVTMVQLATLMVAFTVLLPLVSLYTPGPHWYSTVPILILWPLPVTVSFTSTNLIVNNAASTGNRASVHGLGQTVACFARCVGPVVIGYTWSSAVSIGRRYLPFILIVMMALLVFALAMHVPDHLNHPKEAAPVVEVVLDRKKPSL